jgi:hypothetical protein
MASKRVRTTARGSALRRAPLTVALVALGACAPGDDPWVPPWDAADRPPGEDAGGDEGGPPPDVPADALDGADEGGPPPDVPVDGRDETPPPPDVPADEGSIGPVEPPLGGASAGSGGEAPVAGELRTAGAIQYRLVVPSSYAASRPSALLLVYSGTEGGAAMTANMQSVAAFVGLDDCIIAVLDGTTYRGDGAAGATVLDALRGSYNIDNDATWLLSESAGTTAGLELGLRLRPSYFAAYWANDVNAAATPARTAAELGFAPWGNAGPGGDFADAAAIVAAMRTAGYRLPADAPYSGPGAGVHGSTDQFLAACQFFPGKTRR